LRVVYKKKIVFFSSGQNHHKYLIKFLKEKKIVFDYIFFDKKKILPPFKTGLTQKKIQQKFEKKIIKKFTIYPKPSVIYDLNSKESILSLKKIRPDLGILFGTRKVSIDFINLFKDGVVNIHRGYIQKYRGLDSEYWTLYHNDLKKIGSTLHYIDKNIDTGDIISQKFLRIDKNFQIHKLRYLTTRLSCKMLVIFLKKYFLSKKIKIIKQKKIGRYYSFIPNVIMRQVEKKFKKNEY
jgi:methionyl-tRNA formyltransferase